MRKIIELVKSEITEVVGCTEPAAIAFAFSSISHFYGKEIKPNKIKAKLYLSKKVYRNAESAGIPGICERGIYPASALGIVSKSISLNVFSGITKEQLLKSKLLLRKRSWLKIIVLNRKGIYIRAELKTPDGLYKSVIRDRHDNLEKVLLEGKALYRKKPQIVHRIKNVKEIYDIVNKRSKELERIAKEFMLGNGMALGNIKQCNIADIVYELVKKRMSGEHIKILTIVGSGNHGIFLSLPFYQLYKKQRDKILPGLLFSILTVIYLTQKKERLSDYCGLASKASPALVAGLSYLKGARLNEIGYYMELAEETTSGLLCEGAKESCANKSYLCLRNAHKIIDENRKLP
ncbi:MAG: L-serine ammonia-lyase, iron-sulfur-dependent, subunit alpha [Patescibacteria group bacterium]|nr:L-serine ammonia-lyase, iron-sulfur-dependent, subunit alpha [Patescibacteria group bacterium]